MMIVILLLVVLFIVLQLIQAEYYSLESSLSLNQRCERSFPWSCLELRQTLSCRYGRFFQDKSDRKPSEGTPIRNLSCS